MSDQTSSLTLVAIRPGGSRLYRAQDGAPYIQSGPDEAPAPVRGAPSVDAVLKFGYWELPEAVKDDPAYAWPKATTKA